ASGPRPGSPIRRRTSMSSQATSASAATGPPCCSTSGTLGNWSRTSISPRALASADVRPMLVASVAFALAGCGATTAVHPPRPRAPRSSTTVRWSAPQLVAASAAWSDGLTVGPGRIAVSLDLNDDHDDNPPGVLISGRATARLGPIRPLHDPLGAG